jgi:hypothetical protein
MAEQQQPQGLSRLLLILSERWRRQPGDHLLLAQSDVATRDRNPRDTLLAKALGKTLEAAPVLPDRHTAGDRFERTVIQGIATRIEREARELDLLPSWLRTRSRSTRTRRPPSVTALGVVSARPATLYLLDVSQEDRVVPNAVGRRFPLLERILSVHEN